MCIDLPIDCHLIFTIFGEVDSGASVTVYADFTEMVRIDHAKVASNQNFAEYHTVLGMVDQTGSFDSLLKCTLCTIGKEHGIDLIRDLFRFYRNGSLLAIDARNDTRTTQVIFGIDGSHNCKRAHIAQLIAAADLTSLYILSPLTVSRTKTNWPNLPNREAIQIKP